MTLTVGSSIGPYEIVLPLGSGGMGEVYRARDKRLGREVALKVLQSQIAGSPELRERFEREARTISSLSHPNICTLYDVGRDGDLEYLVMELLDGEALSDRLARGPLPLAQLVRYGIQIAEALEHAHRAGVIHRDLKPANIMITSNGAKLLDFGLAKLAETSTRVFSPHSAPATAATPLTAEGSIVGTLHYMSPEQLEGKPLDSRSDMFAFGVVLYEMATGRRPFEGTSQAGLIASILSGVPQPIRSLHPDVPVEIERIVATALEKDPAERWQAAQDVARQLRWLTDSSSHAALKAAPSRGGGRRRSVLIAAIAAGIAIASASIGYFAARSQRSPASPLRLHLAAPDGLVPAGGLDANMFAISPDGRRLAFVSSGPGERVLSIRNLDSFESVPVPGSNDAVGPFWSEDGQSIGFSARGKLWRWRLAGSSEPIPICDVAPNGAVATWANGVILFSDAPGVGRRPIMRVAESGGRPEAITTIDEKAREWRHGWPRFLPGGEKFVYQIFTADSVQRSVVLRSLADQRTHVVIENVSKVAFSGEDLLYVRDGNLFAQRFDRSRDRLSGDPQTLAPNVGYFYATAAAEFDASASGVVIFRRDSAPGDLVEVDRSGSVIRELGRGEDFHSLDLSPDGRRAVVSIMDTGTGLGDLWIYDLARGLRERFTNDPGMEVYPIFAPDGNSVVFSRTGGGLFPYLVRRGINASANQLLMGKGHFDVATDYSRDGRSLYFIRRDPTTQDRTFRLRVDGPVPKVEPVLGSSFRERDLKESPSGEWLAYSMDATGSAEVYIQSTSSTSTPRIRVSTAGGRLPRWSSDGRELFYISADRTLVSASPGKGGRWEEPNLTPLFKAHVLDYVPAGKDGFLLCRPNAAGADTLFHVLVSR